MTKANDLPVHALQFYVSAPYACSYLPKRLAQSLVAVPYESVGENAYNVLIQQGFRRSGRLVYRPHCEQCQACVPVRLVLADFKPSRNQKRAYRKHADLTATIMPAQFDEAHFKLYQAYQMQRHSDSLDQVIENESEREQYERFLCNSHVNSKMIAFTDAQGALKAVSVVDMINDGVSAVYTFYDATDTQASYGTFVVLWLAEWARQLNLPYLYLGYWIAESQKMAYKARFQPQEHYINDAWQRIEKTAT